eukprot:3004055-Heterocapsa_arctica.AAC.1
MFSSDGGSSSGSVRTRVDGEARNSSRRLVPFSFFHARLFGRSPDWAVRSLLCAMQLPCRSPVFRDLLMNEVDGLRLRLGAMRHLRGREFFRGPSWELGLPGTVEHRPTVEGSLDELDETRQSVGRLSRARDLNEMCQTATWLRVVCPS